MRNIRVPIKARQTVTVKHAAVTSLRLQSLQFVLLCVDVSVSESKRRKKQRYDGWREEANERGKYVPEENEVEMELKDEREKERVEITEWSVVRAKLFSQVYQSLLLFTSLSTRRAE